MDRDRIAGLSACITRGEATLWCGGYGEANPETGMKALPTTPFLLASVSKAVAALAMMQAVEDGILTLDAPINDHLPFVVVHPEDSGTAITLRHLMTHTAGILDHWEVLEPHYVQGDSPEALGPFLQGYLVSGGTDFDAEANFLADGVGKRHEYSNVGAALAAYLVEAAIGTAFDDLCDDRIFGPLALNAGWHLEDFDPAEVALPMKIEGGQWRGIPHYGFPDYPDGQLRADAHAMATLLALVANEGTLRGTTLLSPTSVVEMVKVQVPGLDPDQGLIWYRFEVEGETVIGHNGAEQGASTEILYRESDGLGLVVLMNTEGGKKTLARVQTALLRAAAAL